MIDWNLHDAGAGANLGNGSRLTGLLVLRIYAWHIHLDALQGRFSGMLRSVNGITPSNSKRIMGMDRARPIERFLPLRPVEFHVLLSLASGERHGYGIIQDAEGRGELDVPDVGTLYRALRRMEDQGLIRAADRRKAPDVGDERRNYYAATPLGLQVARAEAQRMVALTEAARLGGLLEEIA